MLQRDDLLELVRAASAAVVTVCAPAGYGKTTFLCQLAETSDRPVAWVSLDETDDNPIQLLLALASSLDRCCPPDARVLQSLAQGLQSDALPGLVNRLARGPECVLILDDVHKVTARQGVDILRYVCGNLPPSAQLVLAGRNLEQLPIAQLRTRGMLVELGPTELSLTRDQARQLLETGGLHVAPDTIHGLYAQTEGWPAGVFLATLAARRTGDPERAVREFDGADPTIVEFLSAEHLATEGDESLAFLQQTSLLGEFSAPLCDEVLERSDSAARLAAMEQTNGFLVALDRRHELYRYHYLYGQALQAGLTRDQPGLARQIHARASRWHEAQRNYTQAIEHAVKARDERRVAELLASQLQALFDDLDQATLSRWLESLSDRVLSEHPPLTIAAVWLMFQLGDLEKTRHYMRVLDGLVVDGPGPLGEVSGQSAVALLKAALGWEGVSRIGKVAENARRLEPPVSRGYRVAGLCLGASLLLRDRRTAARELLEDVAELSSCALDVGVIADALLALLDLEEHRHTAAEARITQALVRLDSAGLQDGLASAPLTGARAWLELVHNDRAAARVHLEQATSLVSRTLVVPWLATYLQIVLSRVALEVEDLATAQSLLAAARRELMRHPDAGMLPHMLANAECAREAAQGGDKALIEPLTPAELRVLELARTCLSIEEMGRTLCVSKNTVKTHLKAIYAKLTVASRSEAVERARALHLIA